MAASNASMEDKIRNIVRGGEDVRSGWSDEEIVQQASQRTGSNTLDAATVKQWVAAVIAIRSETDNDGQTLQPVGQIAPRD